MSQEGECAATCLSSGHQMNSLSEVQFHLWSHIKGRGGTRNQNKGVWGSTSDISMEWDSGLFQQYKLGTRKIWMLGMKTTPHQRQEEKHTGLHLMDSHNTQGLLSHEHVHKHPASISGINPSTWMGSPGDFPGRQLQLHCWHSSQQPWQQDINTAIVALMPQFHFWDPQLVLVEVSFPPRKASPRAELSAVDHLTSLQFPGGPLLTSPVS